MKIRRIDASSTRESVAKKAFVPEKNDYSKTFTTKKSVFRPEVRLLKFLFGGYPLNH